MSLEIDEFTRSNLVTKLDRKIIIRSNLLQVLPVVLSDFNNVSEFLRKHHSTDLPAFHFNKVTLYYKI